MCVSNDEKKIILKESLSGCFTQLDLHKTKDPTFHWSALKYAKTGDTILHTGARLGHGSLVRYLLSFTPAAVDCTNNDNKTPLHEAAQFSQEAIVEILLGNGANVNAIKRADWTALMLACTKKHFVVVETLVKHGALINCKNKDGWTSLHLSAREGILNIFKLLVENQADINLKTKNGRNVLHIAALHGHLDICEYIISLGVDINIRDHCGNTPLHEAVLGNHLEILEILIGKNAEVFCVNDRDFNILHLASSKECLDMITYIVNTLKFEVNLRNFSGWSPLHCAARNKQNLACKLLISLGASNEIIDTFERQPSDYFPQIFEWIEYSKHRSVRES